MENIHLLMDTLEYIEVNLTEDIRTEDIAKNLYCSRSKIEKLFRYYNNISVKTYIIKRRMSRAAKDLINHPDLSVLDIGMRYGYGSNEAFTRAFESVWQVSPSQFKKCPVKYELYPRLNLEHSLMEEKSMNNRKKVDISELYDCIKERRGCYIVVADIRSLVPINDISIKAGDLAIITALNRMDAVAAENDIVFRVGGDEFVILTDSTDKDYAIHLSEEILKRNGETFQWEDKLIPLSMYTSLLCLEEKGNLRYADLFMQIQESILGEQERKI